MPFLNFSPSIHESIHCLCISVLYCEKNNTKEIVFKLSPPIENHYIHVRTYSHFIRKIKKFWSSNLILRKTIQNRKKYNFVCSYSDFLSTKTLLINTTGFNTDKHMQYNFFLYNANKFSSIYQKEREIPIDLFLFMSQNKHKGSDVRSLKLFTKNSKFVSIPTKRTFSEDVLVIFYKNNTVRRYHWKCAAYSADKKRYIFNFSKNRFLSNNFIRKASASIPPCINCPVSHDCHPQGLVNPYECQYLHDWQEYVV